MLQIDDVAHTLPARRHVAERPIKEPQPCIAALSAGDLPLIERFLLETDVPTRTSRFGNAVSNSGLASYARDTLQHARLLLGIFVDEELRGLLEAYDCGDRRLEVALIVASAFRRKGLATSLLREAIARRNLIDARTYQLIFAPENWAMRRLAQKNNARLDLVLGEFCADIDLSWR